VFGEIYPPQISHSLVLVSYVLFNEDQTFLLITSLLASGHSSDGQS
jgi:hypothetical protein